MVKMLNFVIHEFPSCNSMCHSQVFLKAAGRCPASKTGTIPLTPTNHHTKERDSLIFTTSLKLCRT